MSLIGNTKCVQSKEMWRKYLEKKNRSQVNRRVTRGPLKKRERNMKGYS